MNDLQNKSCGAGMPKIGLPQEEKQRLAKEYEGYPVSSGRTQYLRYLHGEELTYRQAVLAKCAECCCGYADGRYDCQVRACPLYQHMAYKGITAPSLHTEEVEL